MPSPVGFAVSNRRRGRRRSNDAGPDHSIHRSKALIRTAGVLAGGLMASALPERIGRFGICHIREMLRRLTLRKTRRSVFEPPSRLELRTHGCHHVINHGAANGRR